MFRYAFLTINGVRIDHEENGGLYFECDYNSGKNKEIGVMKFKIFNLSQDVEVGSVVSLDYGRGDFGGRFGTFAVKKRNEGFEGADKYQELICSERAVESSNIVSVSLKGQIKSSQAIREVCKNAGLNLVQVELKNDFVYQKSYSAFGKALDELKKLSDNCGTEFKVEGKEVYFYQDKPKDNQKDIVELTFDSGLITNPAAAEELELDRKIEKRAAQKDFPAGYNTKDKLKTNLTNKFDFSLKCLSIHTIKKGTVISIKGSETFNGLARVYSVELNHTDKWVMNVKIKKM